jgi:hypothetical protein
MEGIVMSKQGKKDTKAKKGSKPTAAKLRELREQVRSIEIVTAEIKSTALKARLKKEELYRDKLRRTKAEQAERIKPVKIEFEMEKSGIKRSVLEKIRNAEQYRDRTIQEARAEYRRQRGMLMRGEEEHITAARKGFNQKAERLAEEYDIAVKEVEQERDKELQTVDDKLAGELKDLAAKLEKLKQQMMGKVEAPKKQVGSKSTEATA